MKHYGDITQLHGDKLEPVDLIVGGSPCQDLSISGKRAGLKGERSGLFMDMIRLIKEMRNETNGLYPRYALWENVVGSYSSNDGLDYSAVLTELARIVEPDTPDVPTPEEGWAKSGILLGSNWSVSWRTHDAQYWGKTIRDSRTGYVLAMGTPQRRRRIALIADFGGQSSYEILFERKGMSGNTGQSFQKGQGITRETTDSVGEASEPLLLENTQEHGTTMITPVSVYDSQVYHGCKEFEDGVSQTVHAQYGTGGNNMPFVVEPFICEAEDDEVYGLDRASFNQGKNALFDFSIEKEKASPLVAKGSSAVFKTVVRRLTPLECERLQGYPDFWTKIPGATDAKRYKALGNSICLPFWEWLANRFVKLGDVKTIGSLFDGIAGFPLVFKRAGAETRWTSEIDPFPESVCKYHFGDEDTGEEGDIEKYLNR